MRSPVCFLNELSLGCCWSSTGCQLRAVPIGTATINATILRDHKLPQLLQTHRAFVERMASSDLVRVLNQSRTSLITRLATITIAPSVAITRPQQRSLSLHCVSLLKTVSIALLFPVTRTHQRSFFRVKLAVRHCDKPPGILVRALHIGCSRQPFQVISATVCTRAVLLRACMVSEHWAFLCSWRSTGVQT